jgi:hypothetical protein
VLRSFPEADLQSLVLAMKQVHERAVVQPLSLPVRGGFLLLYTGVIVLAFATGAAATVPRVVFPLKPLLHQQEASNSPEPSWQGR